MRVIDRAVRIIEPEVFVGKRRDEVLVFHITSLFILKLRRLLIWADSILVDDVHLSLCSCE